MDEADHTPPERDVYGTLIELAATVGGMDAKIERLQIHVEGINAKLVNLPACQQRCDNNADRITKLEEHDVAQERVIVKWSAVWPSLIGLVALLGALVSVYSYLHK